MMTKRGQGAIGAFVLLMTCLVTSAGAMESEYRAYEPAGGVHSPSRHALQDRATQPVVPLEASPKAAGPVYRTGDGSHPPVAPHVPVDLRPGDIPKQDTGSAGLSLWRW